MRKTIIFSSTLLLTLVTVSGCMKPPSSSTSSTSTSRKPATGGTITIDAGGDIAAFTSTTLPPFQYNTLEILCKEWADAHPNFDVRVLKTSTNGDRVTLSTLLAGHSAANIIYQNGLNINNDLGLGYYADLTDYLDMENPYDQEKRKWKEVYNESELATTAAADGHYYYVNLEKNPVGLIVNKTLLNKAYKEVKGISSPDPKTITNWSTLIEVMDVVKEYEKLRKGYYIYDSDYRWYELAIQTNLFGDMVTKGDYLRVNGMVDTEETCRLVAKNFFNPIEGLDIKKSYDSPEQVYDNNRYYEYMKFIEKIESYRAPNDLSRDTIFRKGQLAFLEMTGKQLRNFVGYLETVRFEWDIIPFPDIQTTDSPNATTPIVRGSAGLASSYWITNSAIDSGLVDQCADLLMFLTSKEQNNRLINEHGGGIPLNADENLPAYLKDLNAIYEADQKEAKEGKRNYWGAFNAWGAFTNNMSDTFIRNVQLMHNGTQNLKETTFNVCRDLYNTVQQTRIDRKYDEEKW